jgi:hypothetical protein
MKSELPADLRARVLAAAVVKPAPTRAAVQRTTLTALGVGVAALLGVFFACGGADMETRPPAFLAMTFGGWAVIAAVATWIGAARGGKMLGRSGAILVVATLATGPGLMAWMLLGTSMWPGTVGYDAPLPAHLACLAFVAAMAVGPFVALTLIRRGSDPVHPRATGAALGAVAGAWAGVMGDLHCPVSDALHVGVSHVLPVLLFAAVGVLLGRRVFGLPVDPA